MKIDKMSLYRVGTGWVFDVETNTGYRVDRTGESRRGKIRRFVKAFELHYDISGEAIVPVYLLNVPVGVVRKAVNLIGLYKRGELEERNGIYH